MLPLQASFTAGELSPLLRARVDMARYATGAARLENFIVLPQGGITRRPGFTPTYTPAEPVYIAPFRYNTRDTAVIIFNGTRVITAMTHDLTTVPVTTAPDVPVYSLDTISRLRYAQLGNMMILTHPDYPPCVLRRESMSEWNFTLFDYKDGPWLSGSGKKDGEEFLYARSPASGSPSSGANWDFFGSPSVFGKLQYGDTFRADITVGGEFGAAIPGYTQDYISPTIPVKGQWEFVTADRQWAAKIYIEKSYDGGKTWFVVKTYEKAQKDDGVNFMASGAETEDDVLYRVRVDMADNDAAPLKYSFVAAPFVKNLSFKVLNKPFPSKHPLTGEDAVHFFAELESDTHFVPYESKADVVDWALSAWGGGNNGYPAAVAFYQDRLVFAGSRSEPQGIWMSKTGDYSNFAVSDPLRDDDAITIALAGDENDEIHSLVSMADLLAFTGGGEWRIRGSGDSGAIAPSAVVAHQQTRIGSKPIQPVVVGQSAVFVHRCGTMVHAIGYNLQADGYTGSELSILSGHIFDWRPARRREIVDMAWQDTPDSILWLTLSDGTMAACTYNPEHEVVAWSRHSFAGKRFGRIISLPSPDRERGTEIYSVSRSEAPGPVTGAGEAGLTELRSPRPPKDNTVPDGGPGAESPVWVVERMGSRFQGDVPCTDRSVLETLSVNLADGLNSTLPLKKLISRVFVYAVYTKKMTVSPAGPGFPDDSALHRIRSLDMEFGSGLDCVPMGEVMLDSGFGQGAAMRIESVGYEPLTILAVVPVLSVSGH